jgi:hypothetical protein
VAIGIDNRRGFRRRTWERKPKGPTARARAKKARAARTLETRNKQKVRDRDGVCRFPECNCGRERIMLHVSHTEHKGMGGNPTGSRSVPSKMLLLCAWRHREGRIAIDQGTLRWEATTPAGAAGPIDWYASIDELHRLGLIPEAVTTGRDEWLCLARGVSLHTYEIDDEQRPILEHLAEMNV